MKSTVNPMRPAQRLADAPRCKATAKTTRCRCKGPAVKGWSVCRMHGARGGAPSGPANGRWRHGNRTRELVAERREIKGLVREAHEILDLIRHPCNSQSISYSSMNALEAHENSKSETGNLGDDRHSIGLCSANTPSPPPRARTGSCL